VIIPRNIVYIPSIAIAIDTAPTYSRRVLTMAVIPREERMIPRMRIKL